jgi:hypothetical protein
MEFQLINGDVHGQARLTFSLVGGFGTDSVGSHGKDCSIFSGYFL